MTVQEIKKKVEKNREDIIQFLREICAIPSMDGQLKEVGERIGAEMTKLGFEEVRFDKMGNILGRIGSGKRVIVYDSHIDTVGVGDPATWGWDPFKGKVENGILSMDVSVDPFFIWGDMWGQVDTTHQKLAIDLDKYPVLEMRVRQSVDSAPWELFGRVGAAESLLNHKFTVTGKAWQRLHIDLRHDVRWRGVLSAFRIDPTSGVDAHVEIDWVRLIASTHVEHAATETIGAPAAPAARIQLEVPQRTIAAGATQDIAVTVIDAAGVPVAGQPVRVFLAKSSNGVRTLRPALHREPPGQARRRPACRRCGVRTWPGPTRPHRRHRPRPRAPLPRRTGEGHRLALGATAARGARPTRGCVRQSRVRRRHVALEHGRGRNRRRRCHAPERDRQRADRVARRREQALGLHRARRRRPGPQG